MYQRKFKPGDMVRIGGRIAEDDPNYHKRGIVAHNDDGYLIVNMIEPFKDGKTRINWLSEAAWELCDSGGVQFVSLL